MQCLNDVMLAVATENSVNFRAERNVLSDHTLSWSVKPQGSQVFVTCACKSKCTWVFRSPAIAALWALRFLTEPTVAARGATRSANLTLWYPSSGTALRLRGVLSGELSETPILSTNDSEITEPDDPPEYKPELPF